MKGNNAGGRQIAGNLKSLGQTLHPHIQEITAKKTLSSRESLADLPPEDLRRMSDDRPGQKIGLETQEAALLRKANDADNLPDEQSIRQLFQDYLRMYSSRDDMLTAEFSEDFSGFTGGGDFLVKDK